MYDGYRFLVERHLHKSVGLIIWGAITVNDHIFIFIRGNMTAGRYVEEMLQSTLFLYLDDHPYTHFYQTMYVFIFLVKL